MKNDRSTPSFLKIIEWSDEDNCYVGSAPPLIGPCCHGKNEAKVFKELTEIVDEWIAIFKKDGTPFPEMDKKKFTGKFIVRIDPEAHRRLAAKARVEGESLNQYVARQLAKA
jgi:predicted HicB family RNase H-like nuclease